MDRLVNLQGWRGAVLLIILGACSALVFPPTCFLFILPVTLPLLVLRTEKAGGWKSAFAQGYGFGFGLHTVGLSWLVNAILIRAHDFWWLVPIVSPVCALLLALWTGLATLFYYWIAPTGWKRGVTFAGLWTLCDMSRAFLLPPQWWNPILTGFPWNPLGSGWAVSGRIGDILIQPASVIGIDGLTFLTVLLALCSLYGRKGILTLLVALIGWIGFGMIRLSPAPVPHSDTPILAMIQGDVAEDDKIANANPRQIFENYMKLTQEGVQKAVSLREQLHEGNRPILFAWPESSFPGNIQGDGLARSILMQNNPEAMAGILGAVTIEDTPDGKENFYNSLVLLQASEGDLKAQYDKRKLVPFGESQPGYIPFHLVPGLALTPGVRDNIIHYSGISPFGALICYEVIFSGQILDSGERPQWILNITNDAWYGNSAGPRQHLAAARMRAVEEGIPVVRVANTGISAVFDPYGREMTRIDWGKRESQAVALPGALPFTVFGYGHRLIPFLLVLFSIGCGIFLRTGEKKYFASN